MEVVHIDSAPEDIAPLDTVSSEADVKIAEIEADRDIERSKIEAGVEIARIESAEIIADNEEDLEWLENRLIGLESAASQTLESLRALSLTTEALQMKLAALSPTTAEELIPLSPLEAGPTEVKRQPKPPESAEGLRVAELERVPERRARKWL